MISYSISSFSGSGVFGGSLSREEPTARDIQKT
jgi:hypothetical protein